jgi:Ca2+-binding EF-hand superfamily protein
MEEIEVMMKFVDTDHNGKLNYTEFIACCLENSVVFKE